MRVCGSLSVAESVTGSVCLGVFDCVLVCVYERLCKSVCLSGRVCVCEGRRVCLCEA